MNRDGTPEWFAVIVFILTIVAAFCAAYAHNSAACQRDNLQKQAVERGFAEWKVDAAGNTKWQWKEARNEAKEAKEH